MTKFTLKLIAWGKLTFGERVVAHRVDNTFADYDFRDLKPEDFVREHSLEMVSQLASRN